MGVDQSTTIGLKPAGNRFAIVAIPANNEADRIEACLAALAVQRDRFGAPLPAGSFEVLVFANNCVDGTAAAVRAVAAASPHPVVLVEERLAPEKSNAGWARKRAMDLAADRLIAGNRHDALILTTDADSLVGLTWIDATRHAVVAGADAVAGYIDAHPLEMLRLGPGLMGRGRLEDRYLRLVAEIEAICDPRPHDPWPNHRVSSGASLAVTLPAYLAIGGLPPKPVGEDAALTAVLDAAGFRVRHAMDVCVSTSCRFDGRARGGAADTMRHRHAVLEAPCDGDLEPALSAVRRALCKGLLRRHHDAGTLGAVRWAERLGIAARDAEALVAGGTRAGFEDLWTRAVEASPALRRRHVLRPSDLPRQIERAATCIRLLRGASLTGPTAVRAGRSRRAGSPAWVAA